MARYPGALWRRTPGDEPAIRPTQVLFHTMVGSLWGTDAYFRSGRSGGLESHFGVGGACDGADRDGQVLQWRDTEEVADANYRANRRPDGTGAVSIETSDCGQPERPWSPRQLAALVNLGRWLAATHGIPRRICRTPTDPGFGWHVMFGAPSDWTPVAKTCPGATRIAQLREVVLPAIFADQPPQGGLTVADATDILAAIRDLRGARDADLTDVLGKVEQTFNLTASKAGAVLAGVTAAVGASRDTVLGALAALPPPADVDEAAVAAEVKRLLDNQGVAVDEAAILDALRARLEA